MKEYETPDDIKNRLIQTMENRPYPKPFNLEENNRIRELISKPKVKPIFVLYLDVQYQDNVTNTLNSVMNDLGKELEEAGWLFILISMLDGRNTFVESYMIDDSRVQDFEYFKEQILQKIEGVE